MDMNISNIFMVLQNQEKKIYPRDRGKYPWSTIVVRYCIDQTYDTDYKIITFEQYQFQQNSSPLLYKKKDLSKASIAKARSWNPGMGFNFFF